jgi:tetratricopeptide (TPR) repeat protein
LFFIPIIDDRSDHLNRKGEEALILRPTPTLALALVSVFLWALPPAAMAQESVPDPADPCLLGKELYQAADFLKARKALMDCLQVNGPSVEALLPLAVMAAREGRPEESESFSAQAVEIAPEDPEARYWHGRALLRLNRVSEARAEWESGLSHGFNHMGILEGLARLSLSEGEPAKGYQLLEQMKRQGMDEVWLHRLMADIAASRGLWEKSLGHLEDAMLKKAPTLGDLLTASELSIMAGKRDQALAFCRRAVALEPGSASYGGLGEAFFAVDQMDSALVYLRLAVEQDPANSQHRFNLANALEVTGSVEEAGSHFQIFLAAQPDDAVGHFNYGVHLDKQGRSDEALYHVTRAIEIEPQMLSARVVRIQLLENVKRWDEAMSEIAVLREASPENSPELAAWEDRIMQARAEQMGAVREGKVHILHMVLGQKEILDKVLESLELGANFEELTVRYSGGPAAARGGDIGWIKPADMVEPLRSAIEALAENEISPPVESRGLYHLFKRIP